MLPESAMAIGQNQPPTSTMSLRPQRVAYGRGGNDDNVGDTNSNLEYFVNGVPVSAANMRAGEVARMRGGEEESRSGGGGAE